MVGMTQIFKIFPRPNWAALDKVIAEQAAYYGQPHDGRANPAQPDALDGDDFPAGRAKEE
jgi:hypothetical protein